MGLTPGLALTSMVTRSKAQTGEEVFIVTPQWNVFFRDQDTQVQNAPQRVGTIELSSQDDAIGVTPISSDPLPAGLYRITGYLRITTPAGVSSSVSAEVSWTDGGVSCGPTTVVPTVTGNATNSTGTGTALVRHEGGATPISYSTTYASNPANAMAYALDLTLEAVAA